MLHAPTVSHLRAFRTTRIKVDEILSLCVEGETLPSRLPSCCVVLRERFRSAEGSGIKRSIKFSKRGEENRD